MNLKNLCREPLILELNRVERLYTGGKLLDSWQGITPETDGVNSEEFIVSSIEYMGPGKPAEKGISRTKLADGSYANLYNIINSDKDAFLGERYSTLCGDQAGVLARVGDSQVRLVIQCHPNGEKAKKYLNFPSGKTEAWYIVDTREIDGIKPHLYCGFKKGVTKELWKKLFDEQDVPGMLSCMHRMEVKQGDFVVIEGGMPHAMGSGCLFLEIHEPCDYTIRVERNYSVRTLSDEEMHYGLGFETMLEFFDYTTYTEDEIMKKCVMNPVIEKKEPGGILYDAITYQNTKRFSAKKAVVDGEFTLPDFDGHYIMITVKNGMTLSCGSNEKFAPQGRGIFVPAKAGKLTLKGSGEVVIAYPFQID